MSRKSKRNTKNRDPNNRDIVVNRKARHDFDVEQAYIAGAVLTGSEVKALRLGMVTLGEGHVRCEGGEAFLVGVHISEYTHANRHNHEVTRSRKLLLHRREIDAIDTALAEKGRACIPLRVFLDRGYVKFEIGVGRGKRNYDKRHDLKARDAAREAAQAMARRSDDG